MLLSKHFLHTLLFHSLADASKGNKNNTFSPTTTTTSTSGTTTTTTTTTSVPTTTTTTVGSIESNFLQVVEEMSTAAKKERVTKKLTFCTSDSCPDLPLDVLVANHSIIISDPKKLREIFSKLMTLVKKEVMPAIKDKKEALKASLFNVLLRIKMLSEFKACAQTPERLLSLDFAAMSDLRMEDVNAYAEFLTFFLGQGDRPVLLPAGFILNAVLQLDSMLHQLLLQDKKNNFAGVKLLSNTRKTLLALCESKSAQYITIKNIVSASFSRSIRKVQNQLIRGEENIKFPVIPIDVAHTLKFVDDILSQGAIPELRAYYFAKATSAFLLTIDATRLEFCYDIVTCRQPYETPDFSLWFSDVLCFVQPNSPRRLHYVLKSVVMSGNMKCIHKVADFFSSNEWVAIFKGMSYDEQQFAGSCLSCKPSLLLSLLKAIFEPKSSSSEKVLSLDECTSLKTDMQAQCVFNLVCNTFANLNAPKIFDDFKYFEELFHTEEEYKDYAEEKISRELHRKVHQMLVEKFGGVFALKFRNNISEIQEKHFEQANMSNEIHSSLALLDDETSNQVQRNNLCEILTVPENIHSVALLATQEKLGLEKLFSKDTFMLRGNKILKHSLIELLNIQVDSEGLHRFSLAALQSHILREKSLSELFERFHNFHRITMDVTTLFDKLKEIDNQCPDGNLKYCKEVNLVRKIDHLIGVMCQNPLLFTSRTFQDAFIPVLNAVQHWKVMPELRHLTASFLWDHFATMGIDATPFMEKFTVAKGRSVLYIKNFPFISIGSLLAALPKTVLKPRLYYNFAYIVLMPYLRVVCFLKEMPEELFINFPEIMLKFLRDHNIAPHYRHGMRKTLGLFVHQCVAKKETDRLKMILNPYWNHPLIVESLELSYFDLVRLVGNSPNLFGPLSLSVLLSRSGTTFLFDSVSYNRAKVIKLIEEGGLDDEEIDEGQTDDFYAFLLEALVHSSPTVTTTKKDVHSVFVRLNYMFNSSFELGVDPEEYELQLCASHCKVFSAMVKSILSNNPAVQALLVYVLFQHYERIVAHEKDNVFEEFTPLPKVELISDGENIDLLPDFPTLPSPVAISDHQLKQASGSLSTSETTGSITEKAPIANETKKKVSESSPSIKPITRDKQETKSKKGKETSKDSQKREKEKEEHEQPEDDYHKLYSAPLAKKEVREITLPTKNAPVVIEIKKEVKESSRSIQTNAKVSPSLNQEEKKTQETKSGKSKETTKDSRERGKEEEETEELEDNSLNLNSTPISKRNVRDVTKLPKNIASLFDYLGNGTLTPKASLKPGTHVLLLEHLNERGFPFLLDEDFFNYLATGGSWKSASLQWEEAKAKVPLKAGKSRWDLWIPDKFKLPLIAKGSVLNRKLKMLLEGSEELRNRLCSLLLHSLPGKTSIDKISAQFKDLPSQHKIEVESGTLFFDPSVNSQNITEVLYDFLSLKLPNLKVVETSIALTQTQTPQTAELEAPPQFEAKVEDVPALSTLNVVEDLNVDDDVDAALRESLNPQALEEGKEQTDVEKKSTEIEEQNEAMQQTAELEPSEELDNDISVSNSLAGEEDFKTTNEVDVDFMEFKSNEITCDNELQTSRIKKLILEKKELQSKKGKAHSILRAKEDTLRLERLSPSEYDANAVLSRLEELKNLIMEADYVAVDFELTGVKFNNDSFPNGFKDCKESADQNSIVQLGLMLMKKGSESGKLYQEDNDKSIWSIPVCENGITADYIWRQESLKFLIKNGFDHLLWKVQCIPYSQLDGIWTALLNKPILTHNGLLDILHLLRAAGRDISNVHTIEGFKEHLDSVGISIYDTRVLYSSEMAGKNLVDLSKAVLPQENLSGGSAHEASFDAYCTGHLCRMSDDFTASFLTVGKNVLLETKSAFTPTSSADPSPSSDTSAQSSSSSSSSSKAGSHSQTSSLTASSAPWYPYSYDYYQKNSANVSSPRSGPPSISSSSYNQQQSSTKQPLPNSSQQPHYHQNHQSSQTQYHQTHQNTQPHHQPNHQNTQAQYYSYNQAISWPTTNYQTGYATYPLNSQLGYTGYTNYPLPQQQHQHQQQQHQYHQQQHQYHQQQHQQQQHHHQHHQHQQQHQHQQHYNPGHSSSSSQSNNSNSSSGDAYYYEDSSNYDY